MCLEKKKFEIKKKIFQKSFNIPGSINVMFLLERKIRSVKMSHSQTNAKLYLLRCTSANEVVKKTIKINLSRMIIMK